MSSLGGLKKANFAINRAQQRKDWQLLCTLADVSATPPDWTQSIKKVDAHILKVAADNGIDATQQVFGRG